MTPYYADPWLTVWQGDCREAMAAMEPESVHCVVTSPPYWGLRDYGTATWEGGDSECKHKGEPLASSSSSLAGYTSENVKVRTNSMPIRGLCHCGARRIDGQLGLEPTPEEYVANMVAVFREVRRVLRPDGTVWLNLGDSYASSGGEREYGSSDGGTGRGPGTRRYRHVQGTQDPLVDLSALGAQATESAPPDGSDSPSAASLVRPAARLKAKDLVGIPWRVAFALQADGWYLRSDIIWSKPNPMPESVTDRPTKSHEYLFLLSKSARYYFDAEAVREAALPSSIARYAYADGDTTRINKGGAYRDKWDDGDRYIGVPTVPDNPNGHNIRSVWTIATQPYPGAHFATFPQKLVEPCVKAGCPEGGTVLDPFAGTGTVGIVAQRLSRRAVLIDLSLDYLGQLMDRNRDIPMGLVG